MSNPFYTIKFADVTKTPFIINPDTTNGPTTPSSPVLPQTSVTANTSLLLLGRGLFDYGEPVAQSLVYLLENFASDTSPAYPVQGQLWYKNSTSDLFVYQGTTWCRIPIGNAAGEINIGGGKLVNVGAPTQPSDGLNLSTADSRYVGVAGGSLNGVLTLVGPLSQIILPNMPTSPQCAVSQAYVDAAITNATGGSPGGGHQFVFLTGDTMTGTLNINGGDLNVSTGNITVNTGNLSLLSGVLSAVSVNATIGLIDTLTTTLHTFTTMLCSGATGIIDMSNGSIQNLSTPINAQDAATKDYVDTHTTQSSTLLLSYYNSWVLSQLIKNTVDYPANLTVSNAITELDKAVFGLKKHNPRTVVVSDGVTTTYSIPRVPYTVAANQLHVYVDGIKQIASEFALGGVDLNAPASLSLNTGLAPSTTYTFNLTVDGTLHTDVSVTTGAQTTTFNDLIILINAALSAALIPATCIFDGTSIVFVSHTSGAGSNITLAPPATGTNLFTSTSILIGVSSPYNQNVTVNYAYKEQGIPIATSTSVTFDVPYPVGSVIEFTTSK